MNPQDLTTVFLDIGEVLIGLDVERPLNQIHRRSGLTREEIERRLLETSVVREYESGRLSTEEFCSQLTHVFDLELSFEEFESVWQSLFVLDAGRGRYLSHSLFQELASRFTLIAVSNTNELHFKFLQEVCPLVNEFDELILSHQVKSMKPEEIIYQAALRKAGCLPGQSLFVDDRPENIAAARDLGIHALLFQGEEGLRRDLKKLGVL